MDTDNKTEQRAQNTEHGQVVFYITDDSHKLAERIAELSPDTEILKFNSKIFADRWTISKNIICIMAAGIVVRSIAPLIKNKKTDPAVVVLDEKGSFAISLLSGHIGGANDLTVKIADYLGAQAVITTASDVQGKIALDVWATEKNLYIEDIEKLKKLSAKIVNGRKVTVYTDYPIDSDETPEEFILVDSASETDIIISDMTMNSEALFLRPKNLFVGIGCNRETAKEEIEEAIRAVFQKEKLSFHSIRSIATIDIKKDEQGLLDFARDNLLHIEFFSNDDLNNAALTHKIEKSEAVKAATGAVAVAEPAAISCAKKVSENSTLITPKEKRGNVTLAIAQAEFML